MNSYRTYGEPYFLNYVDYIFWANWHLDKYPSRDIDQQYTVKSITEQSQCGRDKLFVIDTVHIKENEYDSMPLTENELNYINKLKPLEPLGRSLDNKNILYLDWKNLFGMWSLLNSDPTLRPSDNSVAIVIPDNEKTFYEDYKESLNTKTRNVTDSENIDIMKQFLEEFPELNIQTNGGLSYYNQSVLNAALSH